MPSAATPWARSSRRSAATAPCSTATRRCRPGSRWERTCAAQAFFPMQADAQARVVFGLFSFYGVLGMRGQVRDSDDVVPLQNYQPVSASRLVSREHYVMVRA